MNLFSLDSPLYKYMALVFDIMYIGLLWLLASLPLVTIGASTTAAYSVMMRRISNRERSIFKEFFAVFKGNFKHATGFFIILAAFFAMNLFNFMFTNFESYSYTWRMLALAFHLLFAIEVVMVYVHAFPLIARFDNKFLDLVKSSIIMAHKHLLTTITNVVLFAAIVVLALEYPFLLFFVFGPYCALSSMMFIRLYRKYRPELDKEDENKDEDERK